MKKHRKLLITCIILATLVTAAVFFLRWCHTRFLQKMYPRTYSEIVTQEAAANSLDPNLVYAVIRQESGFDPDAESGAGAVGLMQMTPDTFEWLQKKEQQKTLLSNGALREPSVSVRYGCRFLSILIKKYGVLRTALCAYNAGQGRVDEWLKNGSVSKDGRNLDSIPYSETKDYTWKVEKNYEQYRELYGSK